MTLRMGEQGSVSAEYVMIAAGIAAVVAAAALALGERIIPLISLG